MVESGTETDATMFIWVIDKDQEAEQVFLDEIKEIHFLSNVLVLDIVGNAATYTITYGYDVTAAVFGTTAGMMMKAGVIGVLSLIVIIS